MKITTRIASCLIIVLLALPIGLCADTNKIIITEFMAVNSNSIVDEDSEHSDWLELYNNTDAAIDLNGWYLSDNASSLKEWQFPSVSIPKGGYLLVFASGKNRTDPAKNLHTNFKLSGSGEFLAVSEPDSTISFSFAPAFPAQRQDVSYGLYQSQPVYFTTATPGAENVFGSLPFAPNFSQKRGFYKAAFDVTLTLPGGDGQIYYTLDGTRPSKTTGTLYTAPVHITTTTPLSAITINTSNLSSEIITNSYIFLADVLKQPTNPAGYPLKWSVDPTVRNIAIPSDYAMDPNVCNSAEYKDQMEAAMTSIPVINIVTTPGFLFSNVNNANTGGIYIYTGKPNGTGIDWVRPTSVEYFDPASGKEFQLNCELKLHGGNSRNAETNSLKHGFEFQFKSLYGPSKLNFNLFDEKGAANEFNSLVLRGGYNYSWALLGTAYASHVEGRLKAQYLQDPWTKVTQLEMGHPSSHQKFVHLYLNGLYWGLYNLSEEYTNDFMESYMAGKEIEFDVIKEKQTVTSGTITAWNALNSQMTTSLSNNVNYQKVLGKNADGTVNTAYSNLLDVDNYIDYMLLNYYLGNLDWNKNNWTVARNNVTNQSGFRFFCWDAETTMTELKTDLVTADGDDANPAGLIKYLMKNADFKVLFADHVQKQMINTGGTLTPETAAQRYNELAAHIDMPIIGESARWGDCNIIDKLYTKNEHWLPRKQDLLSNYFPLRTDTVIAQLQRKGYFTTIDAPVFTHPGGTISSAISLGMNSNKGTIYYSLDGTDPRAPMTGAVAGSAKTYATAVPVGSSITVKARAKSGSDWSPVTEAVFSYSDVNDVEAVAGNLLSSGNRPNPFSDQTQIYFTLPQAGIVQVDILGIDGRLVKSLFRGTALSGYNQLQWSPADNQGGIYICRIRFEGVNHYLKVMRK